MPTSTFFHLRQEKRIRLIEASWTEFTHVPYPEVSINRIIHAAGIPRGSFYQYFADKEDLFCFLLNEVWDYCRDMLKQNLLLSDGDLFQAVLRIYDQLSSECSQEDKNLERYRQLLKLNPERGIFSITRQSDAFSSHHFIRVNTAHFRRKDTAFVGYICNLLLLCLGAASLEAIVHPNQRIQIRKILEEQVQIILYGCKEKSVISYSLL